VSYTIKNLREVEDVAPKFGFDSVQEARFCFQDLEAADTGLAYHRIKPGQRGLGHRHEDAEEIYLVLDGAGRIRLDDAIEGIGRFDAIRVAPSVTRALEAGPDGMTIVVFGARHASDGEMLNDFWND
jgi:mannose-6-phosphate isomerase-like protein (cupin superfamily)